MPRRYSSRHPRSRIARWTRRLFGLLGTAAVLAVGVVAVQMVLATDDDEAVSDAPAATRAVKAKKKNKADAQQPKPGGSRLAARRREERRRALDEVRRAGYTVVKLADYRADHVLRVLIGKPVGTTPVGLRAFFFVRGDYIGQDATTATLKLRPGRQLEREITLVYTLYEDGDRECCPRGGDTRVHFRWDGETLQPRETIPPAYQRLPPAFTQA
jgi:hypothetical protein